MNKKIVEHLYLDYFNNFLSVECFAEYYGMSFRQANKLILIGRKLNHRRNK